LPPPSQGTISFIKLPSGTDVHEKAVQPDVRPGATKVCPFEVSVYAGVALGVAVGDAAGAADVETLFGSDAAGAVDRRMPPSRPVATSEPTSRTAASGASQERRGPETKLPRSRARMLPCASSGTLAMWTRKS